MNNQSRRSFLKTTAAVTAGTMILPNLLSCSPNGKVNIAVIGVGGRGHGNWPQFINPKNPELSENIVALCDVNDKSAAKGYETLPDVPRFKDFRVMLDKMHKQIDAVVISTPDHTHFAAAMACMEMGKHIYVEKPLAHNIWQLRTLRKAAKHYGVIAMMGNQGHATDGIRRVKEWVDAGVVGDVQEIHAWFNGPSFNPKGYFLKPDHYPPVGKAIPEGLDWNLWLGPVEKRPYSDFYLPRFWRGWYDFGNGELGDWACHTLDAPFWSLELGSPTAVEPLEADLSEMPESFVTNRSVLRFEFPKRGNRPPVVMKWYEGGATPELNPDWGITELGGNGMIMVGADKIVQTGGRPNDSHLVMSEDEKREFDKNFEGGTIPRIENQSPHKEWLKAIKGTGPMPGSDFEYATRLTEMALVGVLSQRFNRRIEFDEKNMKITNHPELNYYLKEDARDGWRYGENL